MSSRESSSDGGGASSERSPHELARLQALHGERYWIRCSGRMWIATARVDDGTEPTIIRDSAEDLAVAMEHPEPRVGRWEPLR